MDAPLDSTSERKESPMLLTLPAELRNDIYAYVFPTPSSTLSVLKPPSCPSPLHKALDLNHSHFHRLSSPPSHSTDTTPALSPPALLAPLLTNRQIHSEARFLALNNTPLYLSSDLAHPEIFSHRSHCVPPSKLSAIQHITLGAKLQDLRALNEAWLSVPFGSPHLRLHTLTIIPQRPSANNSWAYAEVADLSQSHTLAYILAEALKGLRNVNEVVVVNDGAWGEVVWKLVYRSLLYRLFRWGGVRCGIKFEEGNSDGKPWFKALLGEEVDRGSEVGEEVCRLVGKKGDNPDET